MHTQPSFFDPPPVSGKTARAPVRGKTARAKHASGTGAIQAVKTWTWKQSQILQLLASGPLSRQQLSALSGITINSICSSLANLIDQGVVESNQDYEIVQWGSDGETKRERFRLKR